MKIKIVANADSAASEAAKLIAGEGGGPRPRLLCDGRLWSPHAVVNASRSRTLATAARPYSSR
jgi:hypothetical protein